MKYSSSINVDVVQTGVSRHHVGRLEVRRREAHVAPVIVVVREIALATAHEDVSAFNHALFEVVVHPVAALFQ